MYKLILFLGVIALSTSALAQQGRMLRPVPNLIQGEKEIVLCRDARAIADAGIEVMVTSRGQARVMTVAEQSFFGPNLIGQFQVGEQQPRTSRGGLFLNYVARGVTLSIDMNPTSQPLSLGARRNGQPAFIRGVVNTVRLDHDLVCEFVMHAL
jgi:hypothetical protein